MAQDKTGVVELRPGEAKAGKLAPPEEPWKPARFAPVWVETENETLFLSLMEIIDQGAGEGRFGLIYGRAGRGKTKTTARWAAQHNAPWLKVLDIWRKGSEMGFLQELCKKLKAPSLPNSKNALFMIAVEQLLTLPVKRRVLFLDEMDLLPKYLNLVRDLAELTAAAVILIGEGEHDDRGLSGLPAIMAQSDRVWSRTLDAVHFLPVAAPAIVHYGWAGAGLRIDPGAATLLNQTPGGGDWRVIRKRLYKLTALANSKKTRDASLQMAQQVLKEELKK